MTELSAEYVRDVTVLMERIAALEGMLCYYRIGKEPTEALHRKLERTRLEWHRIRNEMEARTDG
jgi:hypothetical protein